MNPLRQRISEIVKEHLETWKAQGRTDEQTYGVKNFMTGQGELMIKNIAKFTAEEMKLDGKGIDVTTMLKDVQYINGYNSAVSELSRKREEFLKGI